MSIILKSDGCQINYICVSETRAGFTLAGLNSALAVSKKNIDQLRSYLITGEDPNKREKQDEQSN